MLYYDPLDLYAFIFTVDHTAISIQDPLSSLTALSLVIFYPFCFNYTSILPVEMATYLPLFSQKLQKGASVTQTSVCALRGQSFH